jgi:hypothetical protein
MTEISMEHLWVNAMRHILHKLPYSNRDVRAVGLVDPLIVGRAL